LSGGGLDDGGLPNPCSVEVDIGTFFLRFSGWVEIEKLNNIANEIW
jgi:hypothetical protein